MGPGKRIRMPNRSSKKPEKNTGACKPPLRNGTEEEEREEPATAMGKRDMSKLKHDAHCSYYLWDVKHRQSLLKDEEVKEFAVNNLEKYMKGRSKSKSPKVPSSLPAPGKGNVEAFVEKSMQTGHVRKYLDQEREIYESFREIAARRCRCVETVASTLSESEPEDDNHDETGLEGNKNPTPKSPEATPTASASATVGGVPMNVKEQALEVEKKEKSPVPLPSSTNANARKPEATKDSRSRGGKQAPTVASRSSDRNRKSASTLTYNFKNGNNVPTSASTSNDGNTASAAADVPSTSNGNTADVPSASNGNAADVPSASNDMNTAQPIALDAMTSPNLTITFYDGLDLASQECTSMSNDDTTASGMVSAIKDGMSESQLGCTFNEGTPASTLASIFNKAKSAQQTTSESNDGNLASPLSTSSHGGRSGSSLSTHEKAQLYMSAGLDLSDEDEDILELDYDDDEIDIF